MSNTSQDPGSVPQDFQLKSLNLINSKGVALDVHFLMIELSTFESIFNTAITGWLVLNDSRNLLSNYPIFGFDKIQMVFATPNREEFEMMFYIYKITDRKLVKEREQVYILHLVAQEQIDDFKVRVSKSYKGQLISDIVQDLHTNQLGSSQPITVESMHSFTNSLAIRGCLPEPMLDTVVTAIPYSCASVEVRSPAWRRR
jgi:hypothetical protein